MNREEIIKTLASMVTRNGDYPHQVDLLNPDLTIVVEIIKVILAGPLHFVLVVWIAKQAL